MYLKSLEINGFKSFSNKVNIDFTKGITSIVGPNGSGKSNILDAVLWVLGEQSYKSIRAKDSTDVIFSGGKNKKARSTATVSLVIDNSDRYIDIDEDEIAITRSININGESTYILNNKKSRLKDINSLLMDTGIGKQAYSVIGQGKVERIISSSSQEIRNIIDEAAGIKKAKIEKENANKRLLTVENEIDKIEYVENELKFRVDELEKESKKAKMYVAYEKEIDALKYMIYKYNISKFDKNNNILQDRLNVSKENLDILEKKLNEVNYNIENNKNEKEKIEEELKQLLEKNNSNDEILENLKNTQIEYIDKKANFNADLKFKMNEISKVEKEKIEINKEIENLKISKKEIEENLEKLNKKIDDIKESIEKNNIYKSNLIEKIKKCDENYKQYEVDKIKIEMSTEDLEKRIQQAKKRNELINKEKENANDKLEKIKENRIIDKDINLMYKQLDENNKKKDNLQLRKEELNTKKTVITNNLNNLKLLNNAIQFIHKNSFEDKNVLGPLVSMIEVDSKYQLAVSVIANNMLNDIIVKDSNTAKKYINLLKNNKVGTASFLPIENLYVKIIENKKYTFLRDLVKNISKHNEITTVINYIFSNTIITKDIEEAVKISKEYKGKIVTLDGDVISSTGRITGGYIKKKIDETLLKKTELNNIENESVILEKELEKILLKIKGLQEEKHNLEEFNHKYNSVLREVNTYLYEIEENSKFITQKEKEIIINNETIKNINSNIINNSVEKENLETELRSLSANDDMLLKLNEYNIESAVLNEKNENISKFLFEKQDKYNNVKEEFDTLNLFITKKDEIFSEIENKLSEINNEIEHIKNSNIDYKNIISKLTLENIEITEKYSSLLDDKSKLDIEKNINENTINNLNDELARNEKELVRYAEKIEELKEQEGEIKNYYAYKEVIDENEIKLLEKKISINEKNKQEIGIVNLASIKEYDTEQNRYTKLLNDKFDLLKSKESILSLIQDIDVDIVNKFNVTIENVSKNFEYMCKELLNGAKSSIKIIDENNLIDTGLELKVKYKNKPEQSISLLSGGEKSMLAVSFIMAIFMYKPSPFTFFDEVEAALDDANTKKLVSLLKRFDKSQFILITHNKETMKGSDRLYGVTMNKEIGESVLVSVDI